MNSAGRYKPYPAYKDSGVEWLGDVPAGWEIVPVKYRGMIKYGLGEPPERMDDGIPFIRATDVYRGKIDPQKVQTVDPDDVPWSRNPELKANDILVVRSGAYTGDSALVPPEYAGAIAGYDMVLTVTSGEPKFYAYSLLSRYVLEAQIELARTRAAQPHLNAEELGNVIITTPPLPEQTAIVAFLDRETARIDALIAKKKRLIELLAEKRAAVISHAVTKGLDPDAPMKDSGVEWLGEVPAGWEVKRLRFVVDKIEQGWSPQCHSHKAESGEWGVLKVGCVNWLRFNPDENKALPEDLESRTEYKIEPGDILMSRANTRELLGSAALVESEPETKLILCDKLYRIRATAELEPAFLVNFMCTPQARYHFEREATGASGSMQNIGQDTVKGLPVLVPPRQEQESLLGHLRQAVSKLDALTTKNQAAIAKLQEYRTALITAAVTGKIDVRGEAVS
jgi:type I restriction enzyme, S subunit